MDDSGEPIAISREYLNTSEPRVRVLLSLYTTLFIMGCFNKSMSFTKIVPQLKYGNFFVRLCIFFIYLILGRYLSK